MRLFVEDALALRVLLHEGAGVITGAFLIGAHETLRQLAPSLRGLGGGEHAAELIFVEIRIPANQLRFALGDQRLGDMGRDDDGVDMPALQRRDHVGQGLEPSDVHAVERKARHARQLPDLVMEGRARLGDAQSMAGEIRHAAKSLVISGVGGEHCIALEPPGLFRLRCDDLQLALARQIEEAAGEGGDAEIHVAGHGGQRDGLRRFEILQGDVEPLFAKIAALHRQKQRARGDVAQHADADLVRRQRGGGERSGGEPAQKSAPRQAGAGQVHGIASS